jgi:NAD(P)-dependent dehydrogenase (short-subunit alcohol dehydrogenase family)
MNGINGGTAIVTGAGSGIGRETALRFAEEGASVVVVDVDEDGGSGTVKAIRDADGEATFVRADVTDQDDVDRAVETALEEYGGLDFAHNNAGIEGDTDPLADHDEDDWDRVVDINLKGVWRCMRSEIPEMVADGGGAVVNTASISGLTGSGGAPYVASKHGVIGLTRKATLDYADEDVRINAVCPGVIDTPMVERAGEEEPEMIEQITAGTPAGRLGTPEEVANAVVWLCSDDASFVMGHPMTVDGGLLAQ